MKYIYILSFLLKKDLTFLQECWRIEVINGNHHNKSRPFSWTKLVKEFWRANPPIRYTFWWRLASEMHQRGTERQSISAKKINSRLITKYNIEIDLRAKIDTNLIISHCAGIVITGDVIIGKNFSVRQNTTIGVKTAPHSPHDKTIAEKYLIEIGDNVFIGANACIIGDILKIGNNVKIGAMSFINKNIPDNSTVYTARINTIITTS